ncbi:unnamed protein product [Chondrus crispus]|uniref:Uncharacterized protein n=1 Tax=Chondrus crispus TaxID=2769 RepID=R7QDZ8_CHOCR|nr:unnamed protein product [Chondrus crispus]CDF35676.1 unnamed protein product [Chondrus crispus]|eukprot:XP_005715495.1 unnamed protein product [Chondrus crispus]
MALISTCEQHQAATSLAKKVLVLIKSGKVFSGDFSSSGTKGPDGVDPKDTHTWSMNHFANMLESKTCPLSRKSHDVLTAKVLIPFRGRDEERALCAWLSSEGNLKQLQGICDTMLSLPPLTLKSLHSAIRSQMK